MITMEEQKAGNEIYFTVSTHNQSGKITCSEIYYREVVRQLDGKDYFLLYDTNMIPVREVFEFLNYTQSSQGLNTRIKSLSALKLLYVFKDITGKALSEFTVTDVNNLRRFLRGISFLGLEMSIKLLTRSSNRTINGYRRYAKEFLWFSPAGWAVKRGTYHLIFYFLNYIWSLKTEKS